MICINTSKGVLNTLQFVLIETGQTSEQRVTIVQTTTNQGICSKDCHFRSEILSNSTEVAHLKEARFALYKFIQISINAIVFQLQLIYSTVRTSK